MKSLKEIRDLPTEIGNTHESRCKSYHILNHILNMIKIGESKENIFKDVEFLKG